VEGTVVEISDVVYANNALDRRVLAADDMAAD
jgi:hypothetical protein